VTIGCGALSAMFINGCLRTKLRSAGLRVAPAKRPASGSGNLYRLLFTRLAGSAQERIEIHGKRDIGRPPVVAATAV